MHSFVSINTFQLSLVRYAFYRSNILYFSFAQCLLFSWCHRETRKRKIGHRMYHYKYKFGKTPNENFKVKIDEAVMTLFFWQSYNKKNIGKWYWY